MTQGLPGAWLRTTPAGAAPNETGVSPAPSAGVRRRISDAASGLPERMMVAVSAATVYGFDTQREHGREPTDLIFRLPRSRLEVKVHQRVNVRVVELIDEETDSRVELEGARIGPTHVGDVIDALRS